MIYALGEEWSAAVSYWPVLNALHGVQRDLDDLQREIYQRSGRKIDKAQLSRWAKKLGKLQLVKSVSVEDGRKKFFTATTKGEIMIRELSMGEERLIASKALEKEKADPMEIEFYLERILDEKSRDTTRGEAAFGLLTMSEEKSLPLHERNYRRVLSIIRRLFNERKFLDRRGMVIQLINNVAHNSKNDEQAIMCLRDNFLDSLKEMQRSDPSTATKVIHQLLPDSQRLGASEEVLEYWMKRIKDDSIYAKNLQWLLPQVRPLYEEHQKELRDWLFRLMGDTNDQISGRAADLHRTLVAGPSHLAEVSIEV